jgi:hypothetical protein
MKRIKIKLSDGTQAHLEVLTKDLLKGMKNNGRKEIKWLIEEAFVEGLIHCADLHIRKQKRKCIAAGIS